MIFEVYVDHLHRNISTYLDGDANDNAVWQHCYR